VRRLGLVEGPYGQLTDVRTRKRVAMLGAGSGITPLLALLQDEDPKDLNPDARPPAPCPCTGSPTKGGQELPPPAGVNDRQPRLCQ
jgi:hypothetical protein